MVLNSFVLYKENRGEEDLKNLSGYLFVIFVEDVSANWLQQHLEEILDQLKEVLIIEEKLAL